MVRRLLKRFGKTKILLALGDFAILAVISLVVSHLRFSQRSLLEWLDQGSWAKISFFLGFSLLTILVLRAQGLYKHRVYTTGTTQLVLLFRSLSLVLVGLVAFFFIVKNEALAKDNRVQVTFFLLLAVLMLSTYRILIFHYFLSLGAAKHFLSRRILAVGAGEFGARFVEEVIEKNKYGLKLIGFVDDDEEKLSRSVRGFPVLGTTNEIQQLVKEYDIDESFITIQSIPHGTLLELIEKCKRSNLQVNLVSEHFGIVHRKESSGEFADLQIVVLFSRISPLYVRAGKRLADLILAGAITLLFLPLLSLIVFAIKVTSTGPVFFKIKCVGKNGIPFILYKFRSMYNDCEEAPHRKLVEEFIAGKIGGMKLRNDPRITPVGRLIRKYGFDEMAQLLNVFKGDMSLVGPRAPTAYEAEMFEDWHRRRFLVSPGITGLWQVRGRAEVSFTDMIVLDLYYLENCSIWLDLNILFSTVLVVLSGRGGG